MASVDDLIASFAGGAHVGQEAYDIKALQEYLSQHMSMPPLASPVSAHGHSFRPIPPSRSTSSTRQPMSSMAIPPGYDFSNAFSQPYPSPIAQASYLPMHNDDVAMDIGTPLQQRPGARRGNSYGFGVAPPSPAYEAFESDAFAPLYQQEAGPSDPWARMRSVPSCEPVERQPAFGAFAQQAQSAAGSWFRPAQVSWGAAGRHQQDSISYPTPPREEDEDQLRRPASQDSMDQDEEEMSGPMRRSGSNEDPPGMTQYKEQKAVWERGRRKT